MKNKPALITFIISLIIAAYTIGHITGSKNTLNKPKTILYKPIAIDSTENQYTPKDYKNRYNK